MTLLGVQMLTSVSDEILKYYLKYNGKINLLYTP